MSDRPDLDEAARIAQEGGLKIIGGKYAPVDPETGVKPSLATPSNADPREAILTIVYAHVDLPSSEHETEANIAISELFKLFQAREQEILTEILGELPEKRMKAFSEGGLIPVDDKGRLDSKDIPWAANVGFNAAIDQVVSILERKIGELNG